jgi:hypothetical protein
MKQRKHTQAARAIDPRSLAAVNGGINTPTPWMSGSGQPWFGTDPVPWIVVGTGPLHEPEPSPW